jgi:nucleoside-diphosphate-sugar epimerase
MRILITGATGNLGSLLARHLLFHGVGPLRLMIFRRDVPADLKVVGKTEIVRADLSQRGSLAAAVKGVDILVHFAGVLFKANPEHFLNTTNTEYFKNLVDVAKENGVRRIILISFPHVEGPTSIENPAKGRSDGTPISVHAKTRLQEERYLFANACKTPVTRRVEGAHPNPSDFNR